MTKDYLPVIGDVEDPRKIEHIYVCRLAYMQCRSQRDRLLSGGSYSPHPRWDGGTTDGKIHRSYWIGISQFLGRVGANPYASYEVLFREKATWSAPPPPGTVSDFNLIPEYKAATDDIHRTVYNGLLTDSSLAKSRVTTYQSMGETRKQSVLSALAHPHSQLSPLFGYCLALSEGLSDVAAELQLVATAQYFRYRTDYDKVWEHVLPLEMCTMPVEERIAFLRKLNK